MGLLGSAFGRALAGAGGAAAEISNKYIDAKLQKQRDEALSALRRGDMVHAEEYAQSPDVQARRNTNAEQQTLAQAAAARKAKAAGATDSVYQSALDAESKAETGRKIESANAVLEGTTAAEAKRIGIIGEATTAKEIERAKAMLPLEVKKAYAVADAAGRASAKNREAPGADLTAKLDIVEKTLGRPLTETEKLGLLGLAGKRDPELDTETITEKTVDDQGNERTVQRKVVRRPGAGGQAAEEADPMKAAMDAVREAKEAKPAAGRTPTAQDNSPEGQQSRAIAGLSDEGFRAYKKWISAEPINGRERQLLREAGIFRTQPD